MKEKIYISQNLYGNRKKTGGGNNFLRSLIKQLNESGNFSKSAHSATTILINSHQNFLQNLIMKVIFPNKKFILRIDGKTSLHRRSLYWDSLTEWQAKYLADSVIYQSHWARDIWRDDLRILDKMSKIIYNVCDSNIFKPSKVNQKKSPKIKIIATSNSNNPNKGLDAIYHLDNFLSDLKLIEYEINVFGYKQTKQESKSKNLIMRPSVTQDLLSVELRKADIFFAPFKNDACSNSIIESLACGVPVIAMNSGANGEIIKGNGFLYNSFSELRENLPTIIENLDDIRANAIREASYYSRDISKEYVKFASKTKNQYSGALLMESVSNLSVILGKRFLEKIK